ncbi:CaiB/BaiF CoA transferase family protein [Limosilactobacillus fastidiosus]|uniref:CoA transferase n=1 Tax=Limosilactobacillus fastidiosus TaxID=2759855 RepID=A0A7W3TZJ5_9LACO|nr:CoA transferase [Limosilactobacillus fastidiosus]MBB1086201.1 CoA transferase [Limosilactobacillus fastidiosus]MCD7086528.1 CoA transferase [Limosilactobacillus fastidiosus]MCD7114969.1 CoA transferase [Limosilactobacillus fastidiosus]MCD7116636.1 CoA transferase [Limosilactobacillus fastidiosus]
MVEETHPKTVKLPQFTKLQKQNPHLDKTKPYPLDGTLVIDFTHVLSGPTCTRMLADAGARVIHIERPTGDDTRHMGPYLKDGSSEYFRICNAGKESITLDLKNDKDHQLVEKMIAKADVVVENFRPGVMARLGLGPEEMTKKHPRLIYASISGFGQYGPMKQDAAYDTVVQALSGIMDATGQPAPKGRPTRVGTSVSDVVAGIMGYSAIMTALYAREKTGKGTTVDISMLDSTLSLMVQDLMTVLGPNFVPERIGNRHPYMYPFDTFMCKDDMIAICCGNNHLWELLCNALGKPEWINEPKFNTNNKREANWEAVKADMEAVLKQDTADNWVQKLDAAGIPVDNVKNVSDTIKMPQVIDRGMIKTLADGNSVLGTPLKYGTWNSYGAQKDSPKLNENGDAIRKEFK